MTLNITIIKCVTDFLCENAISGDMDISSTETYLPPKHEALRLVLDRRNNAVFAHNFQPLQHSLSTHRMKLWTKPFSDATWVVPKVLSTICSKYVQHCHLLICYILTYVVVTAMTISTQKWRSMTTLGVYLCSFHGATGLTPQWVLWTFRKCLLTAFGQSLVHNWSSKSV